MIGKQKKILATACLCRHQDASNLTLPRFRGWYVIWYLYRLQHLLVYQPDFLFLFYFYRYFTVSKVRIFLYNALFYNSSMIKTRYSASLRWYSQIPRLESSLTRMMSMWLSWENDRASWRMGLSLLAIPSELLQREKMMAVFITVLRTKACST